jgi:hypothetical protein
MSKQMVCTIITACCVYTDVTIISDVATIVFYGGPVIGYYTYRISEVVLMALPPRKLVPTTSLFLLLLFVISFMHGIYTCIPETNHVARQYNVAAIL